MSIRYTKGRCFVPFPRSSCDSLSFSINIGIWNQQPAISGVDLHETSDTHQVTNKCSKAAKLSINKPPHIISERRWCTDVVAGRTFVQTVVTLVIWSFKKEKISPPKMITWDSLAVLSTQSLGKCYRTSAWVHTVRVEASLSLIWPWWACLLRKWYRGGEVEENAEVLVMLVIVWGCNGLPTQTQQSTHALPFFSTYLGRIERESAPLCRIARTIAHSLILTPVTIPENLRQMHRAPQNGLLTDTQPAEKPHRPLHYCHGSEISKAV